MVVLKDSNRTCMRFGILKESGKLRWTKRALHSKNKIREKRAPTITTKILTELLFETCSDCRRMAAIPQGAFAACKVRDNIERNIMIIPIDEKERASKVYAFNMRLPLEGWELTPVKYNSKLMNSIWGLYNRYSVHNFKKNNDANEGVFQSFVAGWQNIFHVHTPATNSVAAAVVTKNN